MPAPYGLASSPRVARDTQLGYRVPLTIILAMYDIYTERTMVTALPPATMKPMGRRRLALGITVILIVSLAAAAALAAVLLPQYPMRYVAAVAIAPLAVAAAIGILEIGQRLRESAEHLSRAVAEHEAATQRAIEAERARIATELHDVVTHHVSMMVVQAGAARTVLAAAPDATDADATDATTDAAEALQAIESSGRTAIAELRTMLGLLSPDAEGGGAAFAPQPGLADLNSLIGRVSAAGLAVKLEVTGTPRALPPGADLAAYRVVQESLTNVIRHAGQVPTVVRVKWEQKLLISVADEGRGGDGVPGRGLLGLGERLALYGGELAAGPRPGRGWQVRAVLPV
jgi:signal transduction histidine kinase